MSQLALRFFAVGSCDQAAAAGEPPGAEYYIEVGGVVGQGGYQSPAIENARLLEGFIQGGVAFEHFQLALARRARILWRVFNHQQGHTFGDQLVGDLAADAAVAAEDHVLAHSLDLAQLSLAPAQSKVARFLQAQHPLQRLLHHHQATHQDRSGHPTACVGVGHLIAVPHGGEGDEHPPKAVAPIPVLGPAVANGASGEHAEQRHQGGGGEGAQPFSPAPDPAAH